MSLLLLRKFKGMRKNIATGLFYGDSVEYSLHEYQGQLQFSIYHMFS